MKMLKQKAKAYDGLIERLKDLKFACRFSPLSDTIDDIFPELKESESEDERIRKDIIVLVKDWWDRVNKDNISTKEQMIAWLEKQGEYANFLSKIQVGDK